VTGGEEESDNGGGAGGGVGGGGGTAVVSNDGLLWVTAELCRGYDLWVVVGAAPATLSEV
jgi:hypothetical protein